MQGNDARAGIERTLCHAKAIRRNEVWLNSYRDDVATLLAALEAAEARLANMETALRTYFQTNDDHSWGPTQDWHKRHDLSRAEAKLRALVRLDGETAPAATEEGETA